MKASGFNPQQFEKMKIHPGFIAALDQSGGSTPGALRLYGVKESAWSNEAEMFALVHQMRKRIITSPSFNGERIIGAILFEDTMDRDIESLPTADYLWNVKQVVPFLKVDKGLAAEHDGVQLMKPMPALAELLTKAKAKRIFGTKMRSVIKRADEAEQILAAGLLPIVEPEVDVHSTSKAKSEELLKAAILEKLNQLTADEFVVLKLTLPEQDDLYLDLIGHPKVVRVVALSGGYSQEDADNRLRKDHGMVASFSRALVEGLTAQQTDAEFNSVLEKSIQRVFDASNIKQVANF
jgi:fructose-bisphosphate aldolase class I